jgi:hypothetical protein
LKATLTKTNQLKENSTTLKTAGSGMTLPAVPVLQPIKNTSVTQLYSVEEYGKLSEGRQMLLPNNYSLFATSTKIEEADGVGKDVGFKAGGKSDYVSDLREVIAFVKEGSNLEKQIKGYDASKDFESVKPNAMNRLPDNKSLTEKYLEIIKDHINYEDELPVEVSDRVGSRNLKIKEERAELIKELVEVALKEVDEERSVLEKKIDQYLQMQIEHRSTKSLMPSDCREMASYIAGFDAGTSGVDVTDQPVLAGDVYEYKSDHSKAEWPFHYATVIMTDGEDHITMENAASKVSDKFSKMQYDHSWFFEMYGTKKGQTFDDKYSPMLNPE